MCIFACWLAPLRSAERAAVLWGYFLAVLIPLGGLQSYLYFLCIVFASFCFVFVLRGAARLFSIFLPSGQFIDLLPGGLLLLFHLLVLVFGFASCFPLRCLASPLPRRISPSGTRPRPCFTCLNVLLGKVPSPNFGLILLTLLGLQKFRLFNSWRITRSAFSSNLPPFVITMTSMDYHFVGLPSHLFLPMKKLSKLLLIVLHFKWRIITCMTPWLLLSGSFPSSI